MGVVSRTDEFQQIVTQLSAKGGALAGHENGTPSRPHPQQSELIVWSTQIASEIDKTSKKVENLKKMAKSKAIFNDITNEFQDLTIGLKADIDRLNEAMQALEDKTRGVGSNQNYQKHSSNMVDTLKTRMLEVTKEFKDALEERTKALGEQNKRRNLYAVSGGAATNPFAQMHRPSANHDDPENPGAQATAVAYHSSRAVAVENVQKTIGELATMFQKMAVMVTAQEEMVMRIDHDIDDTKANMDAAQSHLLKYFQNISSNRLLIMKVFTILICFVVFFIIFLA
jgi:syntaxin 5